MAADTIVYTLETRDLSTGTVNRIEGSYRKLEQEVQRLRGTIGSAVPSAQQWERQMARITTANGLAYEAFRRFNSAMSGFFIGGGIGLALGAISTFTDKLIEQAKKWLDLETNIARAERAIKQFKQTMAQAVEPALLSAQTAIERLVRQQQDLNAVLSRPDVSRENREAAEARLAVIERELGGYERLRDAILRIGGVQNEFDVARGANQEAIGRRIQQQAKLEFEARGANQESLGRFLRDQGAMELRIAGEIQEQRGLIIRDAAAREFAERGAAQEALGRQIQAASQYEINVTQHRVQTELQLEQAKAATLWQLSTAILAVFGQQNRAALALSKLAAVAQIAVQTRVAYMAALAPPPLGLGPVAGQALANWVLAQGVISAAAVAAASLGGGGGGGGGGSAAPPSAPTSTASERPPIEITVNYHTMVSSEASKREFIHDVIPIIGEVIRENNGVAGRVRITHETT